MPATSPSDGWTPIARIVLPARPPTVPEPEAEASGRAIGHTSSWTDAIEEALPATAPPPSIAGSGVARSRWSGDAWLAWRAGTSGLVRTAGSVPVYGASQAGAVLRYDLAPGSELRPQAYVRAVRALDQREGDVAAGLAMRPLPGVPVTLHGEARLARRGDRLELRPAAFVSAGVDAVPLIAGIGARGYAQAGYVGGRDATAFADGSLVAEGQLWQGRRLDLNAGAGAWGGAQRGTSRLDLGPSASLRFRLGDGSARVTADYRLRVAGNAAPSSGAAVTLSAGF